MDVLVAYIEADYFGGAGTQTAQVWTGGKALGPLHLAETETLPAAVISSGFPYVGPRGFLRPGRRR